VSVPEFLTHERERKLFRDVIDDYLQRRIARAPDSIAYGRWASYVHLWMSCKEQLDGKAMAVESTSKRGGMSRPNPLLKGMLDIESRLQPLEAQLGLNPAARQNIIRGLSAMPAAIGGLFGDEQPIETDKSEMPEDDAMEAPASSSPLGFLQTAGKPHSLWRAEMRRRQFIAGIGSAVAWPAVAQAQQVAMPVIGYLASQSADYEDKNVAGSFLQGLKEAGYVEGRNVAIEYRHAENQFDRLPVLAADLVRSRVAVIVAVGTAEALAAKSATTTIPIVFLTGGDPVALGLVASLNRPGTNLTGSATLQVELGPKQLQLLRQLIPNAAAFGVLVDPAYSITQSIIADLQTAAHTLGRQLVVVNARTESDLETAFASFSQQHVGAALVGPSTFYIGRREQLAALAARHALPAIFPYSEQALAGGLMS
jgi:putative ABC transport system substrate-binding protein